MAFLENMYVLQQRLNCISERNWGLLLSDIPHPAFCRGSKAAATTPADVSFKKCMHACDRNNMKEIEEREREREIEEGSDRPSEENFRNVFQM